MALSSPSSSDNDPSKKAHTLTSDATDHSHSDHRAAETTATTTANQANAGPTTAPMGYPPAMGYPPPYHYNPYVQPYPSQPYAYPPTGVVASGGGGRGRSSFVRGFLAMLIAVIIVTCVASIITWLILRPQVPVFRIETLAVSNLNASIPGKFAAEWAANLTAENPNAKLKIYFEQLRGFVYHGEDFLSSSAVDPTFLPTKSSETVTVRARTDDATERSVGRWVADEIARERGGGAVRFNLRMLALATFKSGKWWSKRAAMKVFCEDLRVGFVGNETSGLFNAGDKPKQCDVYYA